MIDLKEVRNISLVGATNNKEKYGYRILKNLENKGYNLYPVNPNYDEIEGIKTYPSIKELPKEEIDLIVFVVPPKVGIKVLKEAYQEGYKKFWFQPGAESDEIEQYVKSLNDVDCSFIDCIMVETSNL